LTYNPPFGVTCWTSNTRVAVIVPSAPGEKQVALVAPIQSEGVVSIAHIAGVSDVPPVAATSVCSNSTLPGTAEAVTPSRLIPHSITVSPVVEGVAIWSRVFIAAPVATGTCAAVVGAAPLAVQ
jgi:hypothetical protein